MIERSSLLYPSSLLRDLSSQSPAEDKTNLTCSPSFLGKTGMTMQPHWLIKNTRSRSLTTKTISPNRFYPRTPRILLNLSALLECSIFSLKLKMSAYKLTRKHSNLWCLFWADLLSQNSRHSFTSCAIQVALWVRILARIFWTRWPYRLLSRN